MKYMYNDTCLEKERGDTIMKKTIRIISVCLVIVMLTSILSACGVDKKFVGTWQEVDGDTTLVLANDGTGSITESGVSGSVNWNLDDDKVFITISICGMTETEEFSYKFSGDTMALTDAEGETTVYRKAK